MIKKKAIAIVLGGGRGTRLYPLTKDRSKPAVPFAGKYRLVDIPISNCINSGIKQIYILTQFNSASLHNHIANTYIFDTFSNGFVEILAAEQTYHNNDWYQGTADAVRKNLKHFADQEPDYYIILSGDQLYRMDFQDMLKTHIESEAELTIAAKPVSRSNATGLGIIGADEKGYITKFYEKPAPELDITEYRAPEKLMKNALHQKVNESNEYLASMGIYIFNARTMEQILQSNTSADFGKEIRFWEDIGTIDAYWKANMSFLAPEPPLPLMDPAWPIRSYRPQYPPAFIESGEVARSILSPGCVVTGGRIDRSILSPGVRIHENALVEDSILFENVEVRSGARLRRAIVDKHSVIPEGFSIGYDEVADARHFKISRDGVRTVPRNWTAS